MNKKTLLWISIGLVAVCLVFTLVALLVDAAAVIMCVLDLIFMAGAIICIALSLSNKPV